MTEEKRPARSPSDADIEREIRAERKFSLEEAIGRLAGDGLLKGDSPVPRKRQAEFEVQQYLEQQLVDPDRALNSVLLRRFRHSELVLQAGYERPLASLRLLIESLLASEHLLQDFVTEVDREWGRMYRERPHLQTPGAPASPDDPYSFASVRTTLNDLISGFPLM